MTLSKSALIALCLGLHGSPIGLAAGQEPTFRIGAELVVIDLVAVDRQGRFIADLRPDEIEVKEDGKRQAVQVLRLVGQPSDLPASPDASALSGRSPTPGGSSPPVEPQSDVQPPRRLAIVVDTPSLSVDAVPRVRQALLATIADLPPALPVLVATIGPDLQVTQPFTTDKAVLRQAISALPASLDPPAGVTRVFNAIDRLCASAVDQRRVIDAAIDAGEQMVADAQARSAASSEALAILADRLGALEGRKHLVLYSAGHAMSPVTQAIDAVGAAVGACTGLDAMVVRRDASSALGRLANRASTEGLRSVIERANRAQVTFYTLDPVGVATSTIMPSTRGTAQTGGGGAMIAFAGLRADAGRDYVEGLAAETGGLTVKSNDMAVVLRRAWEDATQYYLLGYPPPANTNKHDVKKISVSVKRSGVSVRFRKGYIDRSASSSASPPAGASNADRAIEDALASPARFDNEDIVVTPTVKDGTLSVEVLIPHESITFTERTGRYEADFAVHALLRESTSPPRVTDVPGKDIALRLTPEEHTRITSAANLRVLLTAPAPKTNAQLVVVVRDAGGWIGAREVPCCASTSEPDKQVVPEGVDALVERAAAYVDEFVGRFSNVVLQESLTQTATAAPSTLGGRYTRVLTPGTTTKRQLKSDFLLVRPASTAFWLAFRDVVEVDGTPVAGRQGRLEQLFLQTSTSGLAEAQRIAAEGARFMLGTRTRTTTSPVFALAFLQAHHQPRFRYQVEASKSAGDLAVRVLRGDEVREPTLLRTDTGDNLPLRTRYEIEVATGAVLASEVALKTLGESLVLRTRFALDERTRTYVPAEMTEEHVMRSGARMLTVAKYGGVRSFAVTTSEAVP